jgi:hypothetical protein
MMQWVNDPNSKYVCRLACSGVDIDEAMEERYLRFFNGTCDIDHPTLDIERFIDYLRKDNIEYDPEATDLSVDVLGVTLFNPDDSRVIRISANLYRQRNSTTTKGRFRFTCAHEVFHALYHRRLFRGGGRLVCFGHHIQEDVVEPVLMTDDFTEWQANRGAAGLLMPVSIFKESVSRIRKLSPRISRNILIQELSTRFGVSRRSVEIRLQTLKLLVPREEVFVLENDGIDSYRDSRER